MRFIFAVLGLGLTLICPVAALAKWPMDRTMTIVVPWPPGTGADIVARLLADGMSKKWGNTIVIDNRSGASGNIAQAYVAKAAPDGYTFIVSTPGPAANNMLTFKSLPYNPLKDFSFITVTNEDPMLLVAGPRIKAKTAQAFIDEAKARPDGLQFGHPGFGTYAHMTQLALQDLLQTKFNLVAYRGAPQMVTDLISGNIDAAIDLTGGFLPQIKEGKLRAIAVIGNKRVDQIPDVPTLREIGIDFTAEPWYALEGPKGVSSEIIQEMNAAAIQVLKSPETRRALAAAGITPSHSTPGELEAIVNKEVDKWRPIVVKYNVYSE